MNLRESQAMELPRGVRALPNALSEMKYSLEIGRLHGTPKAGFSWFAQSSLNGVESHSVASGL